MQKAFAGAVVWEAKRGNSGVLLFRWRRVCVYMHVHPLINHKARALQS